MTQARPVALLVALLGGCTLVKSIDHAEMASHHLNEQYKEDAFPGTALMLPPLDCSFRSATGLITNARARGILTRKIPAELNRWLSPSNPAVQLSDDDRRALCAESSRAVGRRSWKADPTVRDPLTRVLANAPDRRWVVAITWVLLVSKDAMPMRESGERAYRPLKPGGNYLESDEVWIRILVMDRDGTLAFRSDTSCRAAARRQDSEREPGVCGPSYEDLPEFIETMLVGFPKRYLASPTRAPVGNRDCL